MKKKIKPLFTCKLIGEPGLGIYPANRKQKMLSQDDMPFITGAKRTIKKLKEQGVIGA